MNQTFKTYVVFSISKGVLARLKGRLWTGMTKRKQNKALTATSDTGVLRKEPFLLKRDIPQWVGVPGKSN